MDISSGRPQSSFVTKRVSNLTRPTDLNMDESLSVGTRVMVLGKNHYWRGPNMWGWEGTIVHDPPLDRSVYGVKFPWWKKVIFIPYDLVCPVYRDCEVCGYAAW